MNKFKWLAIFSLLFCVYPASIAHSISYDYKLQGLNGIETLESHPGKYTLISFGYTSCPDVCPTTLYQEGQVLKRIDQAEKLAVIFVSIDPKYDTLEQLNDYVTYFDPHIIGLTGEYDVLKEMADRYGASFGYRVGDHEVYPPNLPDAYTVYHSTLVYLINPSGEMVDVFDYQIGTDQMIKRIQAILNKDTLTHDQTKDQANSAENNNGSEFDNSCPLPEGFHAFTQKSHPLSDYVSKSTNGPSLLNFWAVWCAPCRQELPLLDKLNQSSKALEIYTVNLGDTPAMIDRQFSDLAIKSLSKLQTNNDWLTDFHGVGLPFSVLFNHGQAVATKNGIIENSTDLQQWAKCSQSR